MPLPMVHMGTAIKIHEVIEKEPNVMFILGTISPDAIHMRQNAEREDKWFTHLYDEDRDDMVANTKTFLDRHLNLYSDPERLEFIRGYATHILTDSYWSDTVHKRFRNRLPGDLTKSDISRLYYIDTDQIDFNIYKSREWRSEIWKQLRETQPFGLEGLLTDEEIDKWKLRTLAFFEDSSKEPKVTPMYITEKEVVSFIDDAADYILELFKAWDIEL